jgi:ABC-type arginine transport system permease subunit
LSILIFVVGFGGAIALAVLILFLRDKYAKAQGKSAEQVRANFAAHWQFYKTLRRCIPGILLIVMGVFFAIDRASEHAPDWPIGLIFIPLGWILVWLLARNNWRRYLELRQQAEIDPFHIEKR